MFNPRSRIILAVLSLLIAAVLFSSCGATSTTSHSRQTRLNLYDRYMSMPGQEAFAPPVIFIPGE